MPLPFWPPFFGRNEPLWEVLGFEISMREPNFEPFSWFEPPFLGVKKRQSESLQKIKENTQWIDQKIMLFGHRHFKMCFLPKESDTSQKCVFFEISRSLIFVVFFVQSLKKKVAGGSKLGFLGPSGPNF